jgi:hypothetical protein
MIWIEPKDDLPRYSRAFGPINWRDIEKVIAATWPDERILRPDDVRGHHDTLPAAIRARGWPKLDAVRGKAIFGLLDGGAQRRAYLAGADNLAKRRMFVLSDSALSPHAAVFKIDDARRQGGRIRSLVEAGFLVATNCDRTGDDLETNRRRLRRSLSSGPHWVCTDFPGSSRPGAYVCVLPDGALARVNPVSGPVAVRGNAIIEPRR